MPLRRLPKGFGSVTKLSGNRRKPYMARPAVKFYKEDGTPITPKAIGYFRTYPEAIEALNEYNRNPYTVSDATFAEMYEMAVRDRQASPKPLSAGSLTAYNAAFKRLTELHDKAFRELTVQQLQQTLDTTGKSSAAVEHELVVIRLVYSYALKYDLVSRDLSSRLQARTGTEDEKGEPFSDEELEVLKQHTDNKTVRQILVLCYTGFRVAAYKTIQRHEDYLRGGVKTKASKDRIVPIHPAIAEWVGDVVGMDAQSFRHDMEHALSEIGLSRHTPHDCRHTFSYLCDKYGVDPFSKRLLLGHSLGTDVTDLRYGHRSIEQLRHEINKIEY